ncbi:MAG: hypothetical protein JXQ87_14510 [Bacteroidia bacterium]
MSFSVSVVSAQKQEPKKINEKETEKVKEKPTNKCDKKEKETESSFGEAIFPLFFFQITK